MNKFGRTTKDCDIRSTSTGKQVASFTLAVDRDFKNAQGECRFPYGASIEKSTKGKQLAVAGRIQTRN